jgi:glycosyltransferase involved in cell wall biosynthesis
VNVLFLAPQPFYVERGTPIAINLLLKVLSDRGHQIDLVTYHLGSNVDYKNVKIHRIIDIPFIRSVPPGYSFRKIICDFLLFFKLIPLLITKRYQVVHAVEESTFIALLIKTLLKINYIYDMDSSIAQQLVDKYPFLNPLSFIIYYLEGLAIRNAIIVVPVCDELHIRIQKYKPKKVVVLWDVSLLRVAKEISPENLREQLNINERIVMYVGNLEHYQGIDLLLESFTLVMKKTKLVRLVIIGGKETDIKKYKDKSRQLGITQNVNFLGPRPVKYLAAYLSQADILVSPRVTGSNTPMKIYSYLDSGKAILATNLSTHTQVLSDQVAVLTLPIPEHFAKGLLLLLQNSDVRSAIAEDGKKLVEERHTLSKFRESVNIAYDFVQSELEKDQELPYGSL